MKRGINQTIRAFTLLEVMIAGVILILVGSATVSLSNSLIQGTVSNSDKSVTNRWATEGLEIMTKLRDDQAQAAINNSSVPIWLPQATSSDQYGWYGLTSVDDSWTMTQLSLPNVIAQNDIATQVTAGELKTSDTLIARRLICVEAVGANSDMTDDTLRCNVDAGGSTINDGDRTHVTSCDLTDIYCLMTKESLKLGRLTGPIIPAGNALKVRSVVVWQDKGEYKNANMATLLTNWKGYSL